MYNGTIYRKGIGPAHGIARNNAGKRYKPFNKKGLFKRY